MRYQPISRNNDFARAYRRGKPQVHPHVVVYVNKNRVGHTRVGITASKKTGGAVQRNRARRVIRNALYQVLPENIGGYDLVFVARGQTAGQKSHQLAKTLERLLKKAGVSLQPQRPVKNSEESTDKIAQKSTDNPAGKPAENAGKNA